MKTKIVTLLAMLFFVFSLSTAQAEYTNWQDSAYPFKQVRTVYIAEMDTSEVSIESAAKERTLKEELVKRANAVKGLKVVVELPRTSKAILPGQVQKASEEEDNNTNGVAIPQEAIDAGASIYILPRLTTYVIDSYLEPAHMEWKSREVKESWKDKDGKWHDSYHTETYPVFIPDQYIPYCDVTATFEWYDTKTGNLIASSEDARTRVSGSNPQGAYQRIVDRFLKNMKKTMGR